MPAVDQIIDRYVQAIGGRAAVERFTTRMVKGWVEMSSLGVRMPTEVYSKKPNKTVNVSLISNLRSLLK